MIMMKTAIATLLEKIKTDYKASLFNMPYEGDEMPPHRLEMLAKFEAGLEVAEGSKYIKILSNRAAWGFVVKGDTDKTFKQGTLLKANSWASPARNFGRANILDNSEYSVYWTGA